MFTTLSRVSRRFSSGILVALVALVLVTAPTFAADNEALGEPCEKNIVRDAIDLLEQAWKKAGILDKKVSEVLGASGESGMPYETIDKGSGPVEPTMQDMINHLRDMLDKGNIVKKEMDGNGTVDIADGISADKIVINKALLAKICNPATSACDKFVCKLQLMATLANELAHVFQEWPTATDKQKCDGEHDSDCLSINALQPILDALSKADGTPHTSLTDVINDPSYVKYMALCMVNLGVTAADLECIHRKLKAKIGAMGATSTTGSGYVGRKQRFAFDLTPPYTRWAGWYYGGHDAVVEGGGHEEEVMRSGTTMVSTDLLSTRFLSVPPGQLVVSRPFFNGNGQMMLASATANSSGNRAIILWRDNDMDGLPESTPLAAVNLPPTFPATRLLYSMEITDAIPQSFHSAGTGLGLMVLDNLAGDFFKIEMQPTGIPMGPAVQLINDPNLTLPEYSNFLHEIDTTPFPMDSRLVFGSVNDGETPTISFQFNGGPSYTPSPPGQTAAQSDQPTNGPGIETLVATPPGGQVTLVGNPFSQVPISSIGRGTMQGVANGFTGPDGTTSPTPTFGQIQGNDLYIVGGLTATSGVFIPPIIHFLPRRGINIDGVLYEETGDASADRIHVSMDPPRLHFLRGTPDPMVFNHEVEIALEELEYGGFRAWSDIDGRRLRHPEIDEIITKVTGFDPPPYAQSIMDFAFDGIASDAVVVARFTPVDGFVAYFFDGANGPGALNVQSIGLPVLFEPGTIEYLDLNGDTRVDIRIADFDGGPPICVLNSANPPFSRFSIGSCAVVPPCCPGNASKSSDGGPGPDVNFADITAVLANFGGPANPDGSSEGDSDCNGDITFGDVTSTLSNWQDNCDP